MVRIKLTRETHPKGQNASVKRFSVRYFAALFTYDLYANPRWSYVKKCNCSKRENADAKRSQSPGYHYFRSPSHSLDMINVTDSGTCLRPAPFRSKHISRPVKISKMHSHAELVSTLPMIYYSKAKRRLYDTLTFRYVRNCDEFRDKIQFKWRKRRKKLRNASQCFQYTTNKMDKYLQMCVK